MLKGKFKQILYVVFLLILFCGFSTVNAWEDGDDIPDPSFNWSMADGQDGFYYMVSSGAVYKWATRAYIVDGNSKNPAHCSIDLSYEIAPLEHVHFEENFDTTPCNGDPDEIPSYEEVNAFWDAYFSAPSICCRADNATNIGNCHTFAASMSLSGTYCYWMDPDVMENALSSVADDNPSTPYQEGDIIFYPATGTQGDHSTIIGVASGGTIYMIYWKFRASGVYWCTNYLEGNQIQDLDTPSACLL